MNFFSMTDEAIAAELGERIQRLRLNKNMTQEQLALAVGVSKPTIIQMERGQVKLTLLISALRALGMIDQVERIIPEVPPSPIQVHKMEGVQRTRATSPSVKKLRSLTRPLINKVYIKPANPVKHSGRKPKGEKEPW